MLDAGRCMLNVGAGGADSGIRGLRQTRTNCRCSRFKRLKHIFLQVRGQGILVVWMTAGWEDRWVAAARALQREHREHKGGQQHVNIIPTEDPDNDFNSEKCGNY